MSKWSRLWDKIVAWFKQQQASPAPSSPDEPAEPSTPSTSDAPADPAPPSTTKTRASFLLDNANTRVMNYLCPSVTDTQFDQLIQRLRLNGDNALYIYLANTGDGSPRPTSMYLDGYGGQINAMAVSQMRARIMRARAAGLSIVAWLTADDSRDQSTATASQHLAHVRACAKHFDDLVDRWVVGLEMDEDGRKAHARSMIDTMHACSDHPVGVHLTTGKWYDAFNWHADALHFQFGFGRTPQYCAAMARDIIVKLDGRVEFFADEYHKSSDSAEAKAIGKALLAVPGVCGVGNGA